MLNPAIEPRTGRNAAISAVNQVILALRYYATGALLNLDKSISLWQSNDSTKQRTSLSEKYKILDLACCATDFARERLS